MSYYSDESARTTYIDPKIYVPNVRASWELDSNEAAYLPDLRITFLGGETDGGDSAYNTLLGAIASCKNWRLMDGKTELCSQNVAQFIQGFRNLNRPNAQNEAVNSSLLCNSLGLTIEGANNKIERVAKVLDASTAGVTNSAYFHLSEVFPMLNSVTHLPTSIFENLRVEVEFDSSRQSNLMDTTKTFATLRPVLVADVLEDPKIVDMMNKNFRAASWLEREHDQFVIPQSANNGGANDQKLVQSVNVKVNGFNNKRVERLLMVKELSDKSLFLYGGTTVGGFGHFASQANYNQKFQVRLNGRNILPRQGIVANNERLAHVVDTYGECTSYLGANQYGKKDNVNFMANGDKLGGQADYIALYLGDYVQDLQINYSREGLQDATAFRPTTQTQIAHIYCECRKQITIANDGSYNISYSQ